MTKTEQTIFDSLSQDMQDAILPFVDEYNSLVKGEKCTIEAYIGYPRSDTPEIDFKIDVVIKWESDNKATYQILTKSKRFSEDFFEVIVDNSPRLANINSRIKAFINDVNSVGKKQF